MITDLERIEGTVARAGGNGFQLAGRPGWLNLSKFARPAPELPEAGDRVAVSLDGRGYVRAVERCSEPLPSVGSHADPSAWGPVPPEPQTESSTETPAPAGPPERDARITRMACLNTTTAILASGGRPVQAAAVLALAVQLEGWVNR